MPINKHKINLKENVSVLVTFGSCVKSSDNTCIV